MSDDRSPESLIEAQLCQVCGHHLGADHIGQRASRGVGQNNHCTNCDACDVEERDRPPGTGDPAEVPDFVTTESPATPAPIAPCGCTNVSSCGKSRRWHKVQASNQRAYFAMLAATMPDVDAEDVLRENTGFGRDIPANLGPAVPPDVAGPAEAHEIMQRVTGQPDYITPAEVAEHVTRDIRAQLAGARLPVRPEPGNLVDAFRRGFQRGHQPPTIGPREIKTSYRLLSDAEAAMQFAIGQHLTAKARRTEQSLTRSLEAMGLPAGDAVVFELRTVGDVPVTVNVLMAQRFFDAFPELTSLVGEAMKALADTVALAVLTLQADVDPDTGEVPRV
jgi:hypothetical protein